MFVRTRTTVLARIDVAVHKQSASIAPDATYQINNYWYRQSSSWIRSSKCTAINELTQAPFTSFVSDRVSG